MAIAGSISSAVGGLSSWLDFSSSKNQAKKNDLCDLCGLERPKGAGERFLSL